MDDRQKDVAIIEASALLLTLIFIVLSLYMSYYAQWYAMWQHECSSNPQCIWPPYMATMSAFVGTLEPFSYAIGFFFVVAALAATVHLFEVGRAWFLAGLRTMEFLFFLVGLILLALFFFLGAQKTVYGLGFIALAAMVLVAWALVDAYRGRKGVTPR